MTARRTAPFVFLDDATPGRERLLAFGNCCGVIVANAPEEVPDALSALGRARSAGRHAAGYFSYELGYLLEPRLRDLIPAQRAVPLLWFGVFDRAEFIEGATTAWIRSRTHGRAYAGPLQHEWDEAAYAVRFDRVRRYIEDGDIYQANLSFRARFAFRGDPLDLYLRLRERSAAAHGAVIDDGKRRILSLSPELFFDLSADGALTARPMKGTAARGADAAADERARMQLAASEKDRAENLMIVDLLRNDLGRIAVPGSVGVRDLFAVETYPTLHTMVSTVTAHLAPDQGVARMLGALFPCGSVTGAPKIRAMQIIRSLEASARGVYCGAIGHFAPDGSARFNVAIRTLTIGEECGELGIGGAIVHDSGMPAEYEECLLKARYYAAGRVPLSLIETLPWSPRTGCVRAGRHLDRMASSANFFGVPFDRMAAAKVLAGIAADGPLRVRLRLDERGHLECRTDPAEEPKPTWRYAISPRPVRSADCLSRHKTGWRDHLDCERERLSALTGCDEVIFLNERGELAEGSRSTIFVRRDGVLWTPPLSAGVLDGCLRRELIETGRCREATLVPADLSVGPVFLGNSLRGLVAGRLVEAFERV